MYDVYGSICIVSSLITIVVSSPHCRVLPDAGSGFSNGNPDVDPNGVGKLCGNNSQNSAQKDLDAFELNSLEVRLY
jgi:hypothetical protein